jgi:hypothetical protein
MNQTVEIDSVDMEKRLKCYVDKGRLAVSAEIRKKPIISVRLDASLSARLDLPELILTFLLNYGLELS